MRLAIMGRAGVFLLTLALAGVGAGRTAAACGLSGLNCSGTTPDCSLVGTCVSCQAGGLLGLLACPIGQICQADGSCSSTCQNSYVDGGSTTGECPAETPACFGGACYTCNPNHQADTFCALPTPDCNGSGVCGCGTDTNCGGDGGYCDSTYAPGACTNVCTAGGGGCHSPTPVCGRVNGTKGECVQCDATDSSACSHGQECDLTTNACVTVDAGASDVDAGADAGSAADSGAVTDGGTSSRDATVDDGGDESDAGSDIYRPGTAEGGGCSVLASGSGTGRGAPVFFGFAGLAGLLFLRRTQRRSDRKRNARR